MHCPVHFSNVVGKMEKKHRKEKKDKERETKHK